MLGQSISHYKILAKLGEGGMGVVYKAEDLKLARTVALKFLPSHTVQDPESRTRFLREAQAAASLNHANICTIFEIDEEHGFLAMEFVDGANIKDRIAERPFKLDEALDIAQQAAQGIHAAHERGIVHRDIKSANLIQNAKGQIKVMDFGLAQFTDRTRITRTGASTGTPAYMSPEQVRAEPVDRRTDIWSLGVVLYEMVSGRMPFRGETDQAVSFAIVSQDPEPLTALRSGVPIEWDRVLSKALAKVADERYQHVDELLVDLRQLQKTPSSAQQAKPSRRLFLGTAAGVAAAAAAGGYLIGRRSDSVLSNPLDGASISRLTDFPGSELDAVISPDGKMVAFLSDREGIFDAWITQIGTGESINLTKGRFTELLHDQMTSLGFTPDGSHVWIRVTNLRDNRSLIRGVWLVPAIGGEPRLFLQQPLAVTWSPEAGRIAYFQPDPGDPISIANRDSSGPRVLHKGRPGEHGHFPTWSPDGAYVYFIGTRPPIDTDIFRVPTAGGAAERVTSHHARVYSPAFLDNRRMLYAASEEDGSASSLYLMDVERKVTRRISFGVEQFLSVSASKDGRRLAACVGSPSAVLWSAPISEQAAHEADIRREPTPNVRAVAPRFGPGFFVYVSPEISQPPSKKPLSMA